MSTEEVDDTVWPDDQAELSRAALEPEELDEPDPDWGTHIGVASGRKFHFREISMPLERRSLKGVEVTRDGIDAIRRHLSRFDSHPHNERMVARLDGVLAGDLPFTEFDARFYAHELRELERFEAGGYQEGPDDEEELGRVWNTEHTATLEEYGLNEKEQLLYHPDVKK